MKRKPNKARKKKVAKKETLPVPIASRAVKHPVTGKVHYVPDDVPYTYTFPNIILPAVGTPLGDKMDEEIDAEAERVVREADEISRIVKKHGWSRRSKKVEDLKNIYQWNAWNRYNNIVNKYHRLERIRMHHAGEVE